jgi:hypothetical protein
VQDSIYESLEYKELAIKNNYNTLEFLLNSSSEFSIVCYIDVVEFNPPVPSSIIEFDNLTLFNIANYTLESASLDKKSFTIETGFGAQNFGSLLRIPLEAIYQIIYKNDLLCINYHEPKVPEDSMDIFLNNPENFKLVKKLKK